MTSASSPALSLLWSHGFQDKCHAHCLSTDSRHAVFYTTAHTGVIFDYQSKTQQVLQGHCNPISAAVISPDKKWIITADSGPESVIVVWDSLTGTPVKTIFDPHTHGVSALAISADAMFISSLSSTDPSNHLTASSQELSLWEWTADNEGALYTSPVPNVTGKANSHNHVQFNPTEVREIVTNGPKGVCFWSWENYKLAPYSPVVSSKKGADFLVSIFLPDTTQAMTSTTSGEIIIWESAEKGASGEVQGFQGDGYGPEETNPVKSLVKTIKLCE